MPQISAADVKALRDETGLPMMDCKKALQETDGDRAAAVQWLRERGKKVMGGRSDRATQEGRIAIHATFEPPVGTIVERLASFTAVARDDARPPTEASLTATTFMI